MSVILHICSQIQPKSSRLRYVKSAPSQIKYNYSFSYAGFNIQLNVSPLRLVVYRQIDACYTSHLLLNTGHNIQFMLCQLCSRSKSNIITVLLVQASTFKRMYLRCDWPFIDKLLRVILHICSQIQGTISGLRYINSRAQSNSMLQQVCILRFMYLIKRISVVILDMSIIQCSLCSTFATKCSINPADYAMSIQVPVKTNIITFLAIQDSIFN
jgi:hypothetical protein